jgi:hypothetical protein
MKFLFRSSFFGSLGLEGTCKTGLSSRKRGASQTTVGFTSMENLVVNVEYFV